MDCMCEFPSSHYPLHKRQATHRFSALRGPVEHFKYVQWLSSECLLWEFTYWGVGAKAYFCILLEPRLKLVSRAYLRQLLRTSAFPNLHFVPTNHRKYWTLVSDSTHTHPHAPADSAANHTPQMNEKSWWDTRRFVGKEPKTGGNVIDDIMSRIFIVESKRHNVLCLFFFSFVPRIFRCWLRVFVYRLEFGKQQLK